MSRLPSLFVRLSSSFAVSAAAWSAVPETAHAERVDDLRAAVEHVEAETGGRILSAETVRIGRGQIHRVKVLTREGRVRVLTVHGDRIRDRGAELAGDGDGRVDAARADQAPASASSERAQPVDESRAIKPKPSQRERPPRVGPERSDPPDHERAPRRARGEMPMESFGERDAGLPTFDPAPSPDFERHDPNLR